MSVAASIASAFLLEIGQPDEAAPDPFSFVELPKGKFLMGGSEEDRYVSMVELPRTARAMSQRIALGRSPVTVCEWSRFRRLERNFSNGSCLPISGVSLEEANEYAKSVVMSDFEEPGEDDVVRKVMADIKEKGADVDEATVRKQMNTLLDTAKDQILSETD